MEIIIRFQSLLIILFLIVLTITEESLYLYYTEDSPSVEFYDCIFHQTFLYCLRPSEPIPLYRNQTSWECYHDGKRHSFSSLWSNNISINRILRQWKSTIEMTELYSRYTKQTEQWKKENDGYLCECTNAQSFGKHCEYKLAKSITFQETIDIEFEKRNSDPHLVQLYGDILCYRTLTCDSGRLCLDWRDICDNVQQCTYGYDEENCDRLEFNECDDNEYRCVNGMCIPNEYFLDGDYDCMDLTDEKGLFNDTICTFEQVNLECDERLCPSNQWSCGDGQCITNRVAFQDRMGSSLECNSRRDQYYMCETNSREKLWTLSNGKCYSNYDYEETHNRSVTEECIYFFKCAFSEGNEMNCPCKNDHNCTDQLENPCPIGPILYPNGAVIAPYILFYYNNPREWSDYTPDLIQLNASIKCRGYTINHEIQLTNLIDFNLHHIENFLCLTKSINSGGYDPDCYNNSKTFNNHSYNFLDICTDSKECISAYRIKDGSYNCVDKSDENQINIVSYSCFNIKNYRFRCSSNEPTCLPVNTLGDLSTDCKNQFDESWMGTGTTLSKMNCNKHLKDDCKLIREYIERSWTIDYDTINSTKSAIPFRAYCDTFWDFYSKKDEDIILCKQFWICRENEWKCRTGQCIKSEWVLDGEWDCSDASDEQGIYAYNHSLLDRNLEEKFEEYYNDQPLSTLCNPKTEFSCFRINTINPWMNITENLPCIKLEKVGDGSIDCIGGLDERNTLEYCHRTTMLGHYFKCQTSDMCVSYQDICDIRCINKTDDEILCYGKERSLNCSDPTKDFTCFDGTCAKSGWCDGINQCLYGEDEYLCDNPYDIFNKPSNLYYRQRKEFNIKYEEGLFQLPRSPIDRNRNKTLSNTIRQDFLPERMYYTCNRGIDIIMYNGSIVCFCPQQYYGDKCQYHSDRLTFIFHVNFSQSIYREFHNSTIVLKMLVLFLYDNQILSSYEFHARPTLEMNTYSKKIDHVVYSRSKKLLNDKVKRYFNRSNIINEHPYAVRIEAYDIKLNEKAEFIAVWQYPIYFDYLPSFRFSKVLHLIKLDPCLSNPCNQYQECHLLMNNKSNYICLCLNNYRGKNCSEFDELCLNDYCSLNSSCKPSYRGLLNRNEFPYCICSANKFGLRCELEYDHCKSHPCQNNGTCFPTSNPDRYFCVCESFYYGNLCEQEKATRRFDIIENGEYKSAVVQYFNTDFSSLQLVLVHQHPYLTLPDFLYYKHIGKISLEIVIVKLYHNTEVNIHLISVDMKVTTINKTTEVSEYNRCAHVSTLFPNDKEISPIKYHSLCINNLSLLCFIDDAYLCICDENHTRVECFIYDHDLDRCSRCLSEGLCLKGNIEEFDDFICICRRCYYGRLCQFNTEQLSFTLDSLIVHDYFGIQLLYLILATIIIFIGGVTNYASYVTFKRPHPRKIGVGNYLLIFTIFSQCSLLILFLKIIHIVLVFSMGDIPCKIVSYMLSVTTRYTYWLTSWITIERVCFVLYPFNNPLKKPRLAIGISFITFIIVAGMHIHELMFYIALKDPDEQTVCVFVMTQDLSRYNRVTVLIHYVIPFCIQILSITLLIVLSAQSRSNTAAGGRQFSKQLKRQFRNQKDLYIAPIIIVLSGLPHIILSFILACISLATWQRHAILVAYFLSYAPQLLGFILFVLPSTEYMKEFQKTRLAKKRPYRWMVSSYRRSTMSYNYCGLEITVDAVDLERNDLQK